LQSEMADLRPLRDRLARLAGWWCPDCVGPERSGRAVGLIGWTYRHLARPGADVVLRAGVAG